MENISKRNRFGCSLLERPTRPSLRFRFLSMAVGPLKLMVLWKIRRRTALLESEDALYYCLRFVLFFCSTVLLKFLTACYVFCSKIYYTSLLYGSSFWFQSQR